jgi:hypothetical protein
VLEGGYSLKGFTRAVPAHIETLFKGGLKIFDRMNCKPKQTLSGNNDILLEPGEDILVSSIDSHFKTKRRSIMRIRGKLSGFVLLNGPVGMKPESSILLALQTLQKRRCL